MPQKNEGPVPVRAKQLQVEERPGEAPDRMIKRFVKKVRADGVLDEVRLRRSYEKPSVKRRRKAAASLANLRRAEHDREKS